MFSFTDFSKLPYVTEAIVVSHLVGEMLHQWIMQVSSAARRGGGISLTIWVF